MESSSSEELSPNVRSATQALMEAAKWKAKYEILKENLAYERKERKKAETNLNKLAYELGTVRGEVKLLEQRIKALTGVAETPEKKPAAEAKVEKSAVQEQAEEFSFKAPIKEAAPAAVPKVTFNEPVATFAMAGEQEQPKLLVSIHRLTPDQLPVAAEIKPVSAEEIIDAEEKPIVYEPARNNEMLFYLTESYKMESAKVWETGSEMLDAVHSSPDDLYYDIINNKGTQEGMYQTFLAGLEKLNSDYSHYRELVPHMDEDLKNLDKVLPYVKYYFSQKYFMS